MSIAFLCFALPSLFSSLFPRLYGSIPSFLAEDILYLGFYLCILFSIESRPDRAGSEFRHRAWRRRRRFDIEAAMLFTGGLAVYFVVVLGIGIWSLKKVQNMSSM